VTEQIVSAVEHALNAAGHILGGFVVADHNDLGTDTAEKRKLANTFF
jgi:hypothetical protein